MTENNKNVMKDITDFNPFNNSTTIVLVESKQEEPNQIMHMFICDWQTEL